MTTHKRTGIKVSIAVAVLIVSFLVFKQVQLWSFSKSPNEMEAFVVDEFPRAKQVIVYSLNPRCPKYDRTEGPPSNRPKMYEWEVFGQVELTSAKERNTVAAAFLDSLRMARDERYLCFQPRHGIKIVTADGREASFVLCFECNAVVGYGLPEGATGEYLADLGQARLNRLLDKYGIKRDAPKDS